MLCRSAIITLTASHIFSTPGGETLLPDGFQQCDFNILGGARGGDEKFGSVRKLALKNVTFIIPVP